MRREERGWNKQNFKGFFNKMKIFEYMFNWYKYIVPTLYIGNSDVKYYKITLQQLHRCTSSMYNKVKLRIYVYLQFLLILNNFY